MKSLFAHNIRIKEDIEGNLYTHSSYNDDIWKRYKTISDNISIIARKENKLYDVIDAGNKFEKFDNSIMNIVYIEDIYRSIVTFLNPSSHIRNNNIIYEAVKNHDCVIARLPSYSGFKAIKYAKKSDLPYICEVVGCPWDAYWNHSLKGKLIAPFMYYNMKKDVREAEYVVYVTNQFLQRRYPTNGKSTNCSNVALEKFDTIVLENRLKRISNTNDRKLIIGTTAAVNIRFKGQQYVIKALGKLKKQGITNLEYQLVGGGNQTYLRSIAEKYGVIDQVKFLGSIPHNRVFEWLDSIDIYVQPSRQEGLPRALIEAMSRGLPAFGAKTAGIPELLEPEFIFSNTQKNIKEICKILEGFDKETMLKQAKRNYEESKKYDKSIIEERRESFFKQFKDAAYIDKESGSY